jgi:hypothetical protein
MMTPTEWNMVLRAIVPTVHAKKNVHEQARAYLTTLPQGETIGTNELIEAMYPRDVADKSLEGDEARTRIYALLAKLALDDMHDCCTKGEATGKKFMGRPARPWLWHAPKVKECCVMCGQVLPEDQQP